MEKRFPNHKGCAMEYEAKQSVMCRLGGLSVTFFIVICPRMALKCGTLSIHLTNINYAI